MKKIASGIFMIVLLLSVLGCSKKEFEKKYIYEDGPYTVEYYIKVKKDVIEQLNIESVYNYLEDGRTKEEVEEEMRYVISDSKRKKVIPSGVSNFIEINEEQVIQKINATIDNQMGTEKDLIDLGIILPNKDKKLGQKGYISFKSYEKMLKENGIKEVK